MTKVLKFTAVMLLLAGGFACEKKENNPTLSELLGTKWGLVGLVDNATGEITLPYCPQNTKWDETCYTFSFDESKPDAGVFDLRGRIVHLDFSTKEVVFPPLNEVFVVVPESNYLLFYEASWTISSCEYKKGKLKFICNNRNTYFLFEPYEEKTIFTLPVSDEILGLARKTFELIGLMDTETDEMVMSCPEDETEQYYAVQFWEGGKARLRFKCLDASLHFDRNPVVLWTDFIDSRCNAADPLFEPVSTIETCVYENNQLKLICNNKKNYLLFKLSEP